MSNSGNALTTQLPKFLVIGSLALLIDIGGYEVLNIYLNGLAAKALSFIAATQLAYVCNKYWTFGSTEPCKIKFLQFNLLYGLTLSVNVLVHSGLTNFTTTIPLVALLAASFTSTSINFVVQKHWIFGK